MLLTGFSEGDDLRDQANVAKIKQIVSEQGKVEIKVICNVQIKDMKYTEVKNEKRLFLRYANSYAASIVELLCLLRF